MSDRDVGKRRSQLVVNSQNPDEISDVLADIARQKEAEEKRAIASKVRIPPDRIEAAIQFWKPVYFSVTKEGRFLNGVEAYELGDESKAEHPDKGPYVAMCNLMALEAMKMMGDHWPTVVDAQLMAFATDREKEVAEFWKQTFAPTTFQAEWAWKACLSVMAGAPQATKEMLEDFRVQLP